MPPYRDTDYQNQHSVGPRKATGAAAVGAVLTGGVPPTEHVPFVPAAAGPPPPPTPPADPLAGLTRTQVMDVQRLLGFGGRDVDGVVGPKTRSAYQAKFGTTSAVTVLSQSAPAAAPSAAPAPAGPPAAYAGGGAVTSAPAATSNPQSVEDQIRQQYGYLASFLDIPEVGGVLRQAITEGWDQSRLQAAVQATQWWRTTSSSVRSWLALTSADPQTAADRVGTQLADVQTQAGKLFGHPIDPARAKQIAEDSLKYGWDATQLQNALASEFHYAAGQQQGQLGQAEVQLRQMAADYLVPLSDQTLAAWEGQIANGTATPDTFKQYMVAQAKGMFPALGPQIDAGLTVQQLADPYRQQAAKDLGISPDAIDFTDPKWSRALTQIDPKTGTPTMMSLYDWQKTVRSDDIYGFKNSPVGKGLAADAILGLAQGLGKVAT